MLCALCLDAGRIDTAPEDIGTERFMKNSFRCVVCDEKIARCLASTCSHCNGEAVESLPINHKCSEASERHQRRSEIARESHLRGEHETNCPYGSRLGAGFWYLNGHDESEGRK